MDRLTIKKPTRLRLKLNNQREVANEMARVYRLVKAGSMTLADGSKFTYMLSAISKALEGDGDKKNS